MGSPRFLADLRSHALLQRLRWTRLAWPLRHRRCCLPTPDTGSASTRSDFGALHTAYDLAVYASPLRLPSRRKTRFRLAATLGRTGLIPARSVRKVSKTPLSSLTHVISSPFPRLSLAHVWHLYAPAKRLVGRALPGPRSRSTLLRRGQPDGPSETRKPARNQRDFSSNPLPQFPLGQYRALQLHTTVTLLQLYSLSSPP